MHRKVNMTSLRLTGHHHTVNGAGSRPGFAMLVYILWISSSVGSPLGAQEQPPNGQDARPNLVVQLGHQALSTAELSADGKLLLTGGGGDSQARLWDVKSGKELRVFQGQGAADFTFARIRPRFSPDGRCVTLADGANSVQIWDVATGKVVKSLIGHTGPVFSAEFSRDGRHILTWSKDRTVRLWDFASAKTVGIWKEHLRPLSDVVLSPDGRRFLTMTSHLYEDTGFGKLHSNRAVRLWSTTNETEIKTLQLTTEYDQCIHMAAFSPNGKLIVTATKDGVVKIWEGMTGELIRSLDNPTRKNQEIRSNGTVNWGVTSLAFAPDGASVVSGNDDGRARVWDTATGRLVHTLEQHSGSVVVRFSADGSSIITHGEDGTVRIWDRAEGKMIRTAAGYRSTRTQAILTYDGCHTLSTWEDGTVSLQENQTGDELQRFQFRTNGVSWSIRTDAGHNQTRAVQFLGSGAVAATMVRTNSITGTGSIVLWDASTGLDKFKLETNLGLTDYLCFSPGRKRLVTWVYSNDNQPDTRISLWNLESGQLVNRLEGHTGPIGNVTFAPNGTVLATSSRDETVRLWDAVTGKPLSVLSGHYWTAFSPDSRMLVTWLKTSAPVFDVGSGKELYVLPDVGHARFSPNGRQILTSNSLGGGKLWNTADGRQLRDLTRPSESVANSWTPNATSFSADGRTVLMARGNSATIWDVATGTQLQELTHSKLVSNADFILSDRLVLTLGSYETAKLWDAASGRILFQLGAVDEKVSKAEISPDGKYVATQAYIGENKISLWNVQTGQRMWQIPGYFDGFSPDGRLVLFLTDQSRNVNYCEVATGKVLCKLVRNNDGTMVVVTPEGHFDAGDLEEVNGLHWVMPDDPFTPLSLEVFQKDYYEPGLLKRLAAGEKLPSVRKLQDLNRVQPDVKIMRVDPAADDPTLVTVTVNVASQSRSMGGFGTPAVVRSSGVHDLQLFRDGQLVGTSPATDGAVPLDAEGQATIHFERIRLPRQQGREEFEFSAYAFNDDRVKSSTHKLKYRAPQPLEQRKGNAYLLCLGVNAFDNPAWNLRFAVADAQSLAKRLRRELVVSDRFSSVTVLEFLSDTGIENGQYVRTVNTATKSRLKSAIERLAGKPGDLKMFPDHSELQQAQPEDLVLLSFSTHGFNGENGEFYLLPSDVGADEAMSARLASQAISTDELSRWLRDVDAGEMVMIVDACHSAATVTQAGFKPGPMGSRGLGQLAYNKRMRILTASQAADVAFEDPRIGHGLLTYALCQDGLERGQADWEPHDGQILLGEWLRYAERRVPELTQAIAAGDLRVLSLSGRELIEPKLQKGLILDTELSPKRIVAQQPSLFDFRRRQKGIETVVRRPGP